MESCRVGGVWGVFVVFCDGFSRVCFVVFVVVVQLIMLMEMVIKCNKTDV
jgi:hypothetical protein